MSHLKLKATHGARGPKPKSFSGWVYSAAKRGAKRFRVHLADGSEKLVAHKNAPDTARRIEPMTPTRVEALDDKDAELGQWTFPVEGSDEPDEEPGYTLSDDDSEQERMLKTFAHLLADAHKLSSRQLVEVVSIQSKHFAEERKNLLSLQLASERLFAKRLRLPPRLRVGDPSEDGEAGEEGGGETEGDSWLQEMLAPYLQRMVASRIAETTASDPAAVNGTATKEQKS